MRNRNAKSGLGKGLSQLLKETQLIESSEEESSIQSIKAKEPLFIPIELLIPRTGQPRKVFNSEKINELAKSLKKNGIIQPIITRKIDQSYEIIAGERRWRAAQIARLNRVPVIIKDLNDEQVLEFSIVENIQRENLNVMEEAQSYQKLKTQFGHTQEVLADVLGKSRSYIANTLRLLTLPEKVQYHIENGDITAGHARALVGIQNSVDFVEQIIKRKLSVRETESLVKRQENKSDKRFLRKTTYQRSADTLDLERNLSAHTKLKVSIEFNSANETGKVNIKYKSLEDLDRICTLLLK